MPSAVWRRLRVLGSWPAAAGHPLRAVTRALAFDGRGVLTVAVPSERWAKDLAPYLEEIRDRIQTISGEKIASIVLRVDPPGGGEA